ncbi:MAG: type II secretion system protein GspG [Puniceicoccales bacterium]|jgi:general secretion pathway protein G|nr:type II secretion system protein GspG [Puniceicoccales bacterium]
MFGGKKLKTSAGFTLIEVLAVVTIIAISVVLVKVMYDYRDKNIKENVAREELALLNCAIEIFKSESGAYPVCESKSVDSNAKELFEKISTKINSLAGHHKWNVVDGKLVDPWNNPYIYRCASQDSVSYVLLSMGPNGYVDESELIDDIYSR